MYDLSKMIKTAIDLKEYNPTSKLYIDYENQMEQALKEYKQNNEVEPITEDVVDGEGTVILSAEMQEINRDYEIKQQLAENVCIEITEENLLTYFEPKQKTPIEQIKEDMSTLEDAIVEIASMIGGE